MVKIEEMAHYAFSGNSEPAEALRIAYIQGANAMMEEIENLLPEGDSRIYNDAGRALIWRLRNRIKELKGV